MNSPSAHPITAGGAATEYTRKFKKHFGDRPTAFALSEHSRPSSSASFASSSSGSSSKVEYSVILDPFAASLSSTHSLSNPQHSLASTSSLSLAGVGPGVVDSETHTQLQNLGWRIRSRINQGYTRSTTTLDPFKDTQPHLFRSERDILSNVTNTGRGWSKVSTAPTISATFDGLRPSTHSRDDMDTEDGAPATLLDPLPKRGLCDSDSDQDEPEASQTHPAHNSPSNATRLAGERRIAGLPKLSFSSSVSSTTSSVCSTVPSHATLSTHERSFTRSHSTIHSPFTHPTSTYMNEKNDEEMHFVESSHLQFGKTEGGAPQHSEMVYDFSSRFNSTDF